MFSECFLSTVLATHEYNVSKPTPWPKCKSKYFFVSKEDKYFLTSRKFCLDNHISPELRHVFGLYVRFWTFLSNLVFFIESWLLINHFHVKYFFFWQFTRLMWSCDWPCPKLKEIWSFKLQQFNGLENTRFTFQNLNLTWTYVVLNWDSENVLLFCHYFLFLTSPNSSPIDIRCNWNKTNKYVKAQLIL